MFAFDRPVIFFVGTIDIFLLPGAVCMFVEAFKAWEQTIFLCDARLKILGG